MKRTRRSRDCLPYRPQGLIGESRKRSVQHTRPTNEIRRELIAVRRSLVRMPRNRPAPLGPRDHQKLGWGVSVKNKGAAIIGVCTRRFNGRAGANGNSIPTRAPWREVSTMQSQASRLRLRSRNRRAALPVEATSQTAGESGEGLSAFSGDCPLGQRTRQWMEARWHVSGIAAFGEPARMPGEAYGLSHGRRTVLRASSSCPRLDATRSMPGDPMRGSAAEDRLSRGRAATTTIARQKRSSWSVLSRVRRPDTKSPRFGALESLRLGVDHEMRLARPRAIIRPRLRAASEAGDDHMVAQALRYLFIRIFPKRPARRYKPATKSAEERRELGITTTS